MSDSITALILQGDPTVAGFQAPFCTFGYSFTTSLLYFKVRPEPTGWVALQGAEGLAAIASSGSATDLVAGSVPAARFGAATIPASALDVTNVVPKAGANLTNADVTRNPGTDAASIYTLPGPTTLTGSHILTLGVTGSPATNLVVQVIRRDTTVNTYTVKDDAGTTLTTLAAGIGASFYFNGTHFALLSTYYVA
jgi:hypothetical protein